MNRKCVITECQTEIRVRYYEVDRQSAVHHTVYPRYFEMGRTELLRENGMDYRSLEDSGVMLVVAKMDCRFKSPARYDDILIVTTRLGKIDRARLEHLYSIHRKSDNCLIVEGSTVLVHVDSNGRLQPMPDYFCPK